MSKVVSKVEENSEMGTTVDSQKNKKLQSEQPGEIGAVGQMNVHEHNFVVRFCAHGAAEFCISGAHVPHP